MKWGAPSTIRAVPSEQLLLRLRPEARRIEEEEAPVEALRQGDTLSWDYIHERIYARVKLMFQSETIDRSPGRNSFTEQNPKYAGRSRAGTNVHPLSP
jgi:hypothetical protein